MPSFQSQRCEPIFVIPLPVYVISPLAKIKVSDSYVLPLSRRPAQLWWWRGCVWAGLFLPKSSNPGEQTLIEDLKFFSWTSSCTCCESTALWGWDLCSLLLKYTIPWGTSWRLGCLWVSNPNILVCNEHFVTQTSAEISDDDFIKSRPSYPCLAFVFHPLLFLNVFFFSLCLFLSSLSYFSPDHVDLFITNAPVHQSRDGFL